MINETPQCPICESPCAYLDTVDFNKSCTGCNGQPRGVDVAYYLCANCRFCFAPMFQQWDKRAFIERIYNAEYVDFDPEYISARPLRNAKNLLDIFESYDMTGIEHLDFGSGNGLLSQTLEAAGWDSSSFDPLIDVRMPHKTFNLITAFEVFEHVPDVHTLMRSLTTLLHPDGAILFTTAVHNASEVEHGVPLTWWYASPRNGHISLFSTESLRLLALANGFELIRFSERYYALSRLKKPVWLHGKRELKDQNLLKAGK